MVKLCVSLVKKTNSLRDIVFKQPLRNNIKKHVQYREMLKTADKMNQVKYSYILNDNWFASAGNMIFIEKELKKKFVM